MIDFGRHFGRVHGGGCETVSESIAPDPFLRERSAGTGTALGVLSVSSNLAIRGHGEKVLHALLCSNTRRFDLRIQYFIGRCAQTSAHVIASELNFPQNSVSAELR